MFAIALAALITGFCFCARSALLRDGGEIGGQRKWATGILIAVGSGILSAMLNMGFAVGGHLLIVASARGYSQLAGTLILWLPIMAGAAVVGLAYTSRLIQREGTWGYFSSAGASVRWFRALVMGVLCFGTIALFGFGIAHAGRIGFVYGPVMTASGSVITSNLWGVARGEWPTAGPRRLMYAATGIIALAFGLLAIVRNYT
jgi:L-rhamnose-H+ transport protein